MSKLFVMMAVFTVLLAGIVIEALRGDKVTIERYSLIDRPACIRPDYSGTTIPPNIGPLNFLVEEDGLHYCVKVHCRRGRPIEVFSRSAKIVIPPARWHELLSMNRGQELYFDIFVKAKTGQWNRFKTITNKIADEKIDSFLVYRKIYPLHNRWGKIGIYQYDLESNDESVVLHNRSFGSGCVNCHTFLSNKTDKMLMHTRSNNGPSMLLIENGRVSNMDSRTQFGSAPIGHTVWHPSGKLIVFTIYKVRQFFHSARAETRDVLDLDSAMGYYLFESRSLKTAAKISSDQHLETFPTWSPDGRYLYFCRAPILWSDRDKVPPEYYDESKYDLMRISYELESDTWGQLETVLSSEQTGLSVIQPRISPDGKFLLFCMCEYSGFPAFQANSDLYLMDLSTRQYERLACNSDQSESWHCWSSNSRWIVFSSKRTDGLFAKAYFSYIDKDGTSHKPFLLAQKDPAFYDSCIKLYQIPELVRGPIPVTAEALAGLIRTPGRSPLTGIPVTGATPKAKAAQRAGPWMGGRE